MKIASLLFATLLLHASLFAVTFVTIGTGCVDGLYYPTGRTICDLSNLYKKQTGIRCAVEASCGSVDNLQLLQKGAFDFAITQSDTLFDAYRDKKERFSHVRAVMGLYPELLSLVVRKDAKIATLSDLKGKKISVGARGSGTEMTVRRLFSVCENLDPHALSKAKHYDPDYAPVALKLKAIDGYFYVVGHPSEGIRKLASAEPIDLVSIDTLSCKGYAGLFSHYDSYSRATIPAGLYPGIRHATRTFGVKAVLVTTDKTPDKVVRALIRAVVKNFDTFKKCHPAYRTMRLEDLATGLGAPLHPAAKSYYKKIGLYHE